MNRILSGFGIAAVIAAGIGAFYLIGVVGLFAVVIGSIVCVECYKRLARYPAFGRGRRALFAFGIACGIVGALLVSSYVVGRSLRVDGEKIKETVVTLDNLMSAMQKYAMEHGRYPSARSMEELEAALVPKYISRLRVRDGWGRPWRVEVNPQNYRIASFGADDQPDRPGSDMPDKNIDSIVSNGMWVSVGPSVAYLNGTVKHVTVLDEKSDRSNTGTVYFTDGGQPYTMLQLRSGDRVFAESREQFEVPPGTYTLRVVIGSGQTYDLPGTVTVERQRFVQRTVGVIPQSYFASSNK